MTTVSPTDLEALIARGEEHGCVAESDVAAFVEHLALDEAAVNEVHAVLEARGLEISDDCARPMPDEAPAQTQYTNVELAVFTTDALQQFLNEAGPPPPARPRPRSSSCRAASRWATSRPRRS